ncbi:DUF2971 domain-containing protein [Thalassotalea ganghwensis]
MSKEFPPIYKFRNVTVNSLSNLSSHTIWFASKDSLNDPFEGMVNVAKPETDDELINFALNTGTNSLVKQKKLSHDEAYNIALDTCVLNREKTLKETKTSLNELISGLSNERNSIGIFSSSQDILSKDDNYPPHISNMLMWSHYADGLRGFCIKFDLAKLFESLKSLNRNTKFSWANIRYVDIAQTVTINDLNESALNILSAIQFKHSQWKYEHELRFFADSIGAMKFSPQSICDFYIGEKMPKEQKHLLMGIINQYYPEANTHTVKAADNVYGIHIL